MEVNSLPSTGALWRRWSCSSNGSPFGRSRIINWVPFTNMGWLYYQHGWVITSIIKYEMKLFMMPRIQGWSLGRDKLLHFKRFWAYDQLYMQGLMLIHYCKKAPRLMLTYFGWTIGNKPQRHSKQHEIFLINKMHLKMILNILII